MGKELEQIRIGFTLTAACFCTAVALAYGSGACSVPLANLSALMADSVMTDSIQEVVVTAREVRHSTSASLIGRMAMRHLQPSSFSDLLELLPGGVSKDPVMGSFNSIGLRQAAGMSPDADYATSALGTSFMIDGVPISTGANMQTSPDASRTDRLGTGKGVDMRSISTDDIERVEIVRGIPSVEYGELTSGLVNIKRKRGESRLEARFKADTQSQLFYVGKGFRMPSDRWVLNTGVSYLDSKIDPRNNRENFKRVNASLRSDKRWVVKGWNFAWNTSLNYTGTFERDEADPDLTVNNTIDYYRNDRHSFAWNSTLSLKPTAHPLLREVSLVSGVSYGDETLHQRKHVAPQRIMPLPVSTEEGSNYVGYLPMLYLADYKVDGRPLNSFVKGSLRLLHGNGALTNGFKAGVEWTVSKNYGRGAVYDVERPLVAGNNSRPRAFKEIPAMHQLSAYVEDEAKLYAGAHVLTLTAGLRATQLLHLDSRYALHGKPYLDPRVNLVWNPGRSYAGGSAVSYEIAGGFGWHTKMPVAAYLYPDRLYSDFEQLNYYHSEEAFRVMNVRTYVEDMTNYGLKAARNFKWEVRGDVSWCGNRLSVTYFREDMKDGFRNTGFVHSYTYNRYDASAFDPYTAGRGPLIGELPFTEERYLAVRSKVTNGSRTLKEGVEYTMQACRFPIVNTRITVSGAYFATTNCNSQALWYKPSIIVNNRELQYVGLYDDVDGSRYRSFNTNFFFDTDIPRLRLNFSLGIQNLWFTSRQTMRRDGVPVKYMDSGGTIHDYDEAALADPYLKQLVRHYSEATFDEMKVPSSTTFNFKATKSFWNERVALAVYVNRLITIEPDYERYGITVRRYSSPYFGMEVNIKI